MLLEALSINDHAKGVFGVGAIQPASTPESALEAAPAAGPAPAAEPVTEPVTESGATNPATGTGASADFWLRLNTLLASSGRDGDRRRDFSQNLEVPRA